MPPITLDELKERLEAIQARTTVAYWVEALRAFDLITQQEELTIKVRLRAQLRQMVNDIPRDEG